MRRIATLAIGFLWAAAVAHAEPPCALKLKASLDMVPGTSGRVTVDVSAAGKPLRMLVDTGAYGSVVSESAATRLGLPIYHDSPSSRYLVMADGLHIDRFTKAPNFQIGSMMTPQAVFGVAPDGEFGSEFDGLLGADFLYFFDVDFDFANAKLNLISPDHCKGQVVYWTKSDYAVVPFWFDERRAVLVDVQLDGKSITAELDTGTTDTVISLDTAVDDFDVKRDAALKSDYRHPFKQLSFGGVSIENPYIRITNSKHIPRMLLGMGILRQLHLYIAYHEEKLYVTPVEQK